MPESEPIEGSEVYEWPEFKAFVERLGIGLAVSTTDLVLHIPREGRVTIGHGYLGRDMSAEEGA